MELSMTNAADISLFLPQSRIPGNNNFCLNNNELQHLGKMDLGLIDTDSLQTSLYSRDAELSLNPRSCKRSDLKFFCLSLLDKLFQSTLLREERPELLVWKNIAYVLQFVKEGMNNFLGG